MSRARESRFLTPVERLRVEMELRRRHHRQAMIFTVLLTIMTSALVLWLLWLWYDAVQRGGVMLESVRVVHLRGLAVVPWGMMSGYSAAGLACLALMLPVVALVVAYVVRELRSWDEDLHRVLSQEDGEDVLRVEMETGKRDACATALPPEAGKRDACATDPLAEPGEGLTTAELRRILTALLQQMQEARDLVKRAQGDLSVEDYGQALAHAHLLIGLAIGCLVELLTRTDAELSGETKGGAEV